MDHSDRQVCTILELAKPDPHIRPERTDIAAKPKLRLVWYVIQGSELAFSGLAWVGVLATSR